MKLWVQRACSAILTACLLAGGVPLTSAAANDTAKEETPMRQRQGLSYRYPTAYADWENGFMTGNGKMGIIVFGNPLDDTIVYCDRGFNKAADANNPTRTFNQVPQETLDAIKKASAEGDFETANTLATASTGYKGGGEGSRHPGYKMEIAIPEDGEVTDYSRVCDFTTGEIKVNWTDNRGDWTRSSFVSRADNVTVQQLTAPTKGKLTCRVTLGIDPDMKMFGGMTFSQDNTTGILNFRAKYGNNTNDAGYEGVSRVTVTGGSVKLEGNVLVVEDAEELLLLTQTEKYLSDSTAAFQKTDIKDHLNSLNADYDTLLKNHTDIHTEIYNRVSVDYGATAEERAMSNEALLELQETSTQPVKALYERIFDSGRFYFLCSGYEKAVTDLCGVWAGDTGAGWGGFYHLDANLNLQISGGVIGDMPEAMEGYFYLNEAWEEDFQINAQKLLGCRGLLAAGNTPSENSGLISDITNWFYPYQYVTGEEAWLLYPFWEHYQVTGDRDFLENRFYPLLRQMGDFYEDFLTETDENGNYIFAGSISPENQPSNVKWSLVNNSSFDIAGARFALETLINVCDILGTEQGADGGVERWSAMLDKFPAYRVNDDGALAEWAWEGLDDSYGHRHSSHLVGVWPYRAITPEADDALYDAAVEALKKRDQHFTANIGHGVLHNALIAANLKNGASVGYRLQQLTKNGFYYDGLISSHNGNHETFCTDACHAVPGIMMEMLISSDTGVLEFLPALPEGLETGSITGVKGRNQTTIEDLTWDMNTNTVTATVRSDIDQTLTMMERQGIKKIETTATVRHSDLGHIAREVTLKAGESTDITLYLDDVDETVGNLALGKMAVASSEKNDTPASGIVYRTADMAVDGSGVTRWASEQTDNEWIYVDLGDTYALSSVVLNWETAYAKAYKLQVSNDAENWTDIYATSDGKGGTETISVQGAGRYVRMLGVQRATTWGYSLYEFEVYKAVNAYGNTAVNRPATASSEKDAAHIADLAVDGNLTTAWQSADEASSDLVVDLGGEYTLSEIALTWGDNFATVYILQISGDKTNWSDLYTADQGKGGAETLPVTGTGRYLRLQMTQSSGTGYTLAELEAYGVSTIPPEADKTALVAAITWPLQEELYTGESWSAYQTALKAARAVNTNKKALQSEVDEALQALLNARENLTLRVLGETIFEIPASGKTYTANKSVLGTDWLVANQSVDLTGRDLNDLYILMTVTLTNDSDTDDAAVFKTGKLRLGSPATSTSNDVAYDIAGMQFNFHAGENLLYFPLYDAEKGYFENGDGTIDWSQIDRFRMYIDSANKYEGTFTLTVGDIQILDTAEKTAVDKTELKTLLDGKKTDLSAYKEASVQVYEALFAAANLVYSNVDATAEEVAAQVALLKNADSQLVKIIYGDLTGEGKVTAEDALQALQAATGKITLTADQQKAGNVDFSTDGIVTANDALLILQFATQKIAAF